MRQYANVLHFNSIKVQLKHVEILPNSTVY